MDKMKILAYRPMILLFLVLSIFAGCEKEVKMAKFESAEGKFSVLMPGVPTEREQVAETPVGSLTMYIFAVQKPYGIFYVAYSDYPDIVLENKTAGEILEGAKNGFLRDLPGSQLISEDSVHFGEDPARELRFEGKKGLSDFCGRAIIILSGNRIFSVNCMTAKEKYDEKTAQKFVDSLEIW